MVILNGVVCEGLSVEVMAGQGPEEGKEQGL